MPSDDVVWDVPAGLNDRKSLLNALAQVESGGNPNAVSPAGAVGKFQFMPKTAARYGIDPRDPAQSEQGANRYLDDLTKQFGDPQLALMAYNWGEGNVQSWLKTGRGVKGQPMPKETQQYVGKVLKHLGVKTHPKQSNDGIVWDDAGSNDGIVWDDAGSNDGIVWDDAPQTKGTASVLPKASSGPAMSPAMRSSVAAQQVLNEMNPVEKTLVGVGKGASNMVDFGKGIYAKAADFFDPQGRSAALEEDIASRKQADDALEATWPGYLGRIAGETLSTAIPAGAAYAGATKLGTKLVPYLTRGLPTEATATLAATKGRFVPRVLNASLGGAAAGATAEELLNRDAGSGALTGLALGPAAASFGSVLNGITKQYQRFRGGAGGNASEQIRLTFGDRINHLLDSLRATKPIVPGEKVTAGLAVDPIIPEIAAMEHIARSSPGGAAFTQADAATAAARNRALSEVAERAQPGPINEATGIATPSVSQMTREQTAGPIIRQSLPDQVPIDDYTREMLKGADVSPKVRAGLEDFRQARSIARANGQPLPTPGRMGPDGEMTHFSIDQLQRIQSALGDDMANANVRAARRHLDKLMRSASDQYATGNDLWRILSRPQEQGAVAEVLRGKLNSPTETGRQNLEAYSRAFLRNPEETLSQAGVHETQKTIPQLFSGAEPDLVQLAAVNHSVAREAAYNAALKNQGIIPIYENPFTKAEKLTPGFLRQTVTALRSVSKSFGKMGQKEMQAKINAAMVDPQAMIDLIQTVPSTQRSKVLNVLRNVIPNPMTRGALIGTGTTQTNRTLEPGPNVYIGPVTSDN